MCRDTSVSLAPSECECRSPLTLRCVCVRLCVGCTQCCPFPQTALPHSVTQPLMTVCHCLSTVASPALMTVSLPNDLAPAPSFRSHKATGLVAIEMLTTSTHFLLAFCGGGGSSNFTPLSALRVLTWARISAGRWHS